MSCVLYHQSPLVNYLTIMDNIPVYVYYIIHDLTHPYLANCTCVSGWNFEGTLEIMIERLKLVNLNFV